MTSALDFTSGSALLAAYGALAVLLVTFVESGLLVVGFFVPGDTLLFPAGVLCASGSTAAAHQGPYLSLWQVLLGAAIGSVAGTQLGYLIGRHGGQGLLARSHSVRLKNAAARSEQLLDRYGQRRAIVLGRFVPVVRSVLGPLAGALRVPTRTFLLWQVVGGLAWTQGTVLAGYALGSSFPGIDSYLLPIVLAVVALSALPLLFARRKNGAGPGPGRPTGREAAKDPATGAANAPEEDSEEAC
jgi:membrane-associated protein